MPLRRFFRGSAAQNPPRPRQSPRLRSGKNNRLRPLPFQRPRAKLAAPIPLPALRPQFAIAGGGMRPHSVFR